MTISYGDFADLDPTQEEMLEVLRVLDEVDAEEAGAGPDADLAGDGDELPEAGPWDDESGQLGAIGETLDARAGLDATRIGEDIVAQLDRRPTDEARLARAMPRIEAGTYVEDAYWRGDPAAAAAAARDPLGRYAAACGPLDDFARCSARYHTPDCHTTIESAAARSSYAEVEAWNETLAGRTPHAGIDAAALGLANEPHPGDGSGDAWADLLDTSGPRSYPDLRAAMMHEMALADQPAPPPREGPDTRAWREALGL